MVHRVSQKGIVGLGALGQALEHLLPAHNHQPSAVLFAVKAFDLEIAMLEQSRQWPESLPFVTLCNGYIWPIIKKIQPSLGPRPIRIGMTTMGSTIESGGSVKFFLEGTSTAWGHWPDPSANYLPPTSGESFLLKSLPGGTWYDDIRPVIRRKWILNVVINSVAAAFRLETNIELTKHKAVVDAALIEAVELAHKIWTPADQDPNELENISKFLWDVIRSTAKNQNSMVRDVNLGRPTETEYLAGLAKQYEGFSILKSLHEQIVG
jgi:ketopantoate reductase